MAAPASLNRFATPEDLVSQLKSLPPSPRVILKLQQMAASDTSDVGDLVAVIRIERALAARIVRISNGPLYSLGARCESIEESVHRLGFREVRRIATVVAGAAALAKPLPSYSVAPTALWNQAVACAVAAEYLARLTGEDEHQAYTAGLMHGVGMIVIDTWVQSIAPGTVLGYHNVATEWTEAERDLLGYDLADAGAALLRSWDFPAAVVEAVRCQYAPQVASNHRRLAAVLNCARWLRVVVCQPDITSLPAPEKIALMTLKLTEQQLRDCLPEVLTEINSARQVLNSH